MTKFKFFLSMVVIFILMWMVVANQNSINALANYLGVNAESLTWNSGSNYPGINPLIWISILAIVVILFAIEFKKIFK